MIGTSKEETAVVPVAVALSLLESRKKGGELGYEQQLAEEHAKRATSLTKDKAEKIVEEITKLGVSTKTAVKVVDIMPLNETQLKQVLVIEKKPVEEETVKAILGVINSHRGK